MPHHLGPLATGKRNPRIAAEFLKHEAAQLEHPRRERVRRAARTRSRRPTPSPSGTACSASTSTTRGSTGDCSAAMPSYRRGSRPRGWCRCRQQDRSADRLTSWRGLRPIDCRLRRASQNHVHACWRSACISWRHLNRSAWRVDGHNRGSIAHATGHRRRVPRVCARRQSGGFDPSAELLSANEQRCGAPRAADGRERAIGRRSNHARGGGHAAEPPGGRDRRAGRVLRETDAAGIKPNPSTRLPTSEPLPHELDRDGPRTPVLAWQGFDRALEVLLARRDAPPIDLAALADGYEQLAQAARDVVEALRSEADSDASELVRCTLAGPVQKHVHPCHRPRLGRELLTKQRDLASAMPM